MAMKKKDGLAAKIRFVVDLTAARSVTPAGAVKKLQEQYPESKPSYLRTVVYAHARKAGARFAETPAAAPERHGLPRAGTCFRRVWDLADQITQEQGRRATRREVRERYEGEGGRGATASAAYQSWNKAQEESSAGHAPPRSLEPRQLAVTADGRCVIPRELRAAMRLQPGDRVIARLEAGELRLVSPAVAVEQVQARMRKYGAAGEGAAGEGVVDRFLAERRALWGEE